MDLRRRAPEEASLRRARLPPAEAGRKEVPNVHSASQLRHAGARKLSLCRQQADRTGLACFPLPPKRCICPCHGPAARLRPHAKPRHASSVHAHPLFCHGQRLRRLGVAHSRRQTRPGAFRRRAGAGALRRSGRGVLRHHRHGARHPAHRLQGRHGHGPSTLRRDPGARGRSPLLCLAGSRPLRLRLCLQLLQHRLERPGRGRGGHAQKARHVLLPRHVEPRRGCRRHCRLRGRLARRRACLALSGRGQRRSRFRPATQEQHPPARSAPQDGSPQARTPCQPQLLHPATLRRWSSRQSIWSGPASWPACAPW